MPTAIRPARADDVPFLAWVILAASRAHVNRGAFDLTVAAPDAEILPLLERLAHGEPASFFHWRGFLIAEVDGRPAAALSGYDPALVHDPDQAFDEAVVAAGWSPQRLEASNASFAPFATCVPESPPGMWVVEWVATRAEYRRRGLVDAMLARILDAGRSQGYGTAQISVFIENTPARNAYEKSGFRLDRERRHPDFQAAVGCPGIAQLRMPL